MTCACRTLSCCPPSDYRHEAQAVRFWYVSDFGTGGYEAGAVGVTATARDADFVVTGGDNCVAPATYAQALAPYQAWVDRRLIYPCPGNHDWDEGDLGAYREFFGPIIGNQRYYAVRLGPLHLFVLDAGWNSAGVLREPDGNTADSAQGRWLAEQAATSDAAWKVAVVHTPPYSSGYVHGCTPALQWPFDLMGIDLVLSGHEHNYERLEHLGVTYIVNGTGGQVPLYSLKSEPIQASVFRYHDDVLGRGLSWFEVSASKLRHEYRLWDLMTKLDEFELTKRR